MLYKLGINFGDSDFYFTFNGVLESIYLSKNAEYASGDLPTDKSKLVFIINRLAFPCYILWQNRFSYNGLEDLNPDHINHMQKYLSVSEKQIFVNSEVDEFINSQDFFSNSDFFMIDFVSGEFETR